MNLIDTAVLNVPPGGDINDIINTSSIIALIGDADNENVGELSLIPCGAYISDTTPRNAKKIVSDIRRASADINDEYIKLSNKINAVSPVTQDEVNARKAEAGFESRDEAPIPLNSAIENISSIYISRDNLQRIIGDVYSELWNTVTEMFTTCFQTSMYARQYTGATLGTTRGQRSYSEITAYLGDQEKMSPDKAGVVDSSI